MYWGAATTNNNMHTIASTLSKSLIQITSNNVNAVPNARGDNTVYSRGAVIAVEKGDDMDNLIELFETNKNKLNEEGNNDTPKLIAFLKRLLW
jgi:tRNA U38,U39,U40 pseudouridine synthase TruA